MAQQRDTRKRDKGRDPNSARKLRRAAQFGKPSNQAGPQAAAAGDQPGGNQRRPVSKTRNKPTGPRRPTPKATGYKPWGGQQRTWPDPAGKQPPGTTTGDPTPDEPGNQRRPTTEATGGQRRGWREHPAESGGNQRRATIGNAPSGERRAWGEHPAGKQQRVTADENAGDPTADESGGNQRRADELAGGQRRGMPAGDERAGQRRGTSTGDERAGRGRGAVGIQPGGNQRRGMSTTTRDPAGGKQRRAMSMPRAPGRIFADGDRGLAEGLVASLRAPAIDDEVADSLTHPLHSYPARLHPATARILVDVVTSGAKFSRSSAIVDPFCGSGTVLVEARAGGHRAIGVDLSPLAVLIARAKTWTVPARRRRQMRETGHSIGGAVLAAGKAARRSGAESSPQRKPAGFDPNARDRRLSAWFSPHVRRELELIAWHLDELRMQDGELADVLTACLSAILYKVSSRQSDTDDSWIHRDVARGAAARQFLHRVDLLEAGLADLPTGGPAEVFELDTRRLGDVVPDGSAAGIVTSPPYAGTYDYAEHQRLRFDFLALRHRDFEAGEIGSRRSFDNALVAEKAWRRALADTLATMTRSLAIGARAAIVIGDSWAGGRANYALDDVRGAIGDDVVVEAWASQERPMLGSGERRAFGDRPKAEHVVLLRRR